MSTPKKPKPPQKTETLEEFLARGGKITVVPPVVRLDKEGTVKSTVSGPAVILSYSEADQLYGEKTTRKKTVKVINVEKITNDPKIKMSLIPEELRKKLGL